jgi:hypothetical protein
MNPFLECEDVWPDVHHRLIGRMADALADQVDPRYLVKIEEQLYVQESPGRPHRAGPRADVGIKRTAGSAGPGPGVSVLEAPVRVHLPWPVIEEQAFLEIRDRSSRELVTVLELISPTNKGRHRDQYLFKRDRILVSTAHLVEIDLLRGGEPLPAPDRPECDYSVLVSRAEIRPEAEYWPIRLREPLPMVPIPLRGPDRDAVIDLQSLLHAVYDAGRYANYIYEARPSPPLRPEDEAWASELLGDGPGTS